MQPGEGDRVGDQADDGGVAAGVGVQRPAWLAEFLHGVPEGVGDADRLSRIWPLKGEMDRGC